MILALSILGLALAALFAVMCLVNLSVLRAPVLIRGSARPRARRVASNVLALRVA